MWNIERINQYINERIEEDLHLDYKAADALGSTDGKKIEISKDVSSFANSDGGVILYGVKEFTKDTKYFPEKIDPVDRDIFSKETLEQIINSRISPKISGVIITPIIVDNSKPNKVVYVVEIPKSNTAHQAADKRYYKRYNFIAVAMDDYEVKDVINRRSKPVIEITMRKIINEDSLLSEDFSKYETIIILKNSGSIAAQYIECYVELDKTHQTLIKKPRPLSIDNKIQVPFSNRIENKITIGNKEAVISFYHQPLLPEVWREIGTIHFRQNPFNIDYTIKCTVTTEFGTTSKDFNLKDLT